MGLAQWIVAAVALQRLGELVVARRNEQRLRLQGAAEAGAGHYPLIVVLHAGWLAVLFVGIPVEAPVYWSLLGIFLLLQGLRVWVIASLGRFWTTRIVTLPGAELSKRGPYRWMRHPNYLIVVGEIALLPLAFGAWKIALVFSLANCGLLAWRVRIEDRVLNERRHLSNSH